MLFLWRLFYKIIQILLTQLIVSGVVIGFLFFAPDLWAPPLLEMISKKCGSIIGGECVIKSMRLAHLFPLTLRWEDVHIVPQKPRGETQIRAHLRGVEASLALLNLMKDWHRPILDLKIKLEAPQVRVVLEENSSPPTQSDPHAGSSFNFKFPLKLSETQPQLVVWDAALHLSLQSGRLEVVRREGTSVEVEDASLQIDWPSLRTPFYKPQLSLRSWVKARSSESPSVSLPLDLTFNKVEVQTDKVKVEQGHLGLGGLHLGVTGFYAWGESADSQFKFHVLPTELKDIPKEFLPPGRWQGHFQGEILVSRQHGLWKADGGIRSENVQAALDFDKKNLIMKGDLRAQVNVRLHYDEQQSKTSGGAGPQNNSLQHNLSLDDTSMSLDLSHLEISYLPWFKKKSQVPLWVEAVAQWQSGRALLQRGTIRLDRLKLDLSGQYESGPKGFFQFLVAINETYLQGIEDLFPVLGSTPMAGSLQMEGSLKGESSQLLNFKNIETTISSLQLKKVEATLHYKDHGVEVKGPLRLQGELSGQLLGEKLTALQGRGSLDFSQLSIEDYGAESTNWRKPNPWPLQVDFNIDYKMDHLKIPQFVLRTGGGEVQILGEAFVRGKQILPQLNLQISKLDLAPWKAWLKSSQINWGGYGAANFHLGGAFSMEEGLTSSPLKLKGRAKMDQFKFIEVTPLKLPVPKPTQIPNTGGVSLREGPLLPTWPLLREADVLVQLGITDWQYQGIVMRGPGQLQVRAKGSLWSLKGELHRFWEGNLSIKKLLLTPFVVPSGLDLQAEWSKIQIRPLLSALSPSLSTLMTGKTSGQATVLGTLRSELQDSLHHLKAEVWAKIEEGQFSSWSVAEKLYKPVSQLGLLKNRISDQGSWGLNGDLQFLFEQGVLNLRQAKLQTQYQDELKVHGYIREAQALDLMGTLSLARGKLALPLRVKGTLSRPDFLFLQHTVPDFIKKTVEDEAQKIFSQKKEKIQNEVEKKLEQTVDPLKKKLKGIFGR